jgi:hypothetical protein
LLLTEDPDDLGDELLLTEDPDDLGDELLLTEDPDDLGDELLLTEDPEPNLEPPELLLLPMEGFILRLLLRFIFTPES